ncbi:hypothetical protein ANCCEY_05490 [Ancylostoma ceylanicum]|uniref:Uncharacterized protein n=1 Tax=Ancylostoma ceylanicum TaxID=53326 RepID=A0A0D6LUB5_9BILA|nr:hypothetical protein ANCCEY_05490 [Ancylostoma ceylanicum]
MTTYVFGKSAKLVNSKSPVTLVEEGVWSGRFRHKVEYRILTSIEKDFAEMYEQLKDKEDMRIHAEHPNEP